MGLLIQVLIGYGMQSPAVRDDQGRFIGINIGPFPGTFDDDRQVWLGDANAGILHHQFPECLYRRW